MGITDAHAVHGIEDEDGNIVVVGKGVEAYPSTGEAFAAKLNGTTGALMYHWKSGVVGNDGSNAVVQLPDGDYLVVGFMKTAPAEANHFTDGVYSRSLTKLNKNMGLVWTTTSFNETHFYNGAWENVELTADRNGVLLGGLTGRPNSSVGFDFKSYGNTDAGKARVMMLPVSVVGTDTAPAATATIDPSTVGGWEYSNDAYHSAKAVRAIPGSTDIAVLLWYGFVVGGDKEAGVVRLSSSGTETS